MTNNGSMDMPAHNQTYTNFIKLVKFCSISIIAVLVIMAITLL